MLDLFDEYTLSYLSLGQRGLLQPLPLDRRLLRYFMANTSETDTHLTLNVQNEFDVSDIPGLILPKQDPRDDQRNKVVIRKGDVILEHRVFRDHLYFISEDPISASLYSSVFSDDHAGHDFQEMNKVGIVLFGPENRFKRFISSRESDLRDREGYKIEATTHDLAITPRFDVNEANFREVMNHMIGIANQVLGIQGRYDDIAYRRINQSVN